MVSTHGHKTSPMACTNSITKPHRTFVGQIRITLTDQGATSEHMTVLAIFLQPKRTAILIAVYKKCVENLLRRVTILLAARGGTSPIKARILSLMASHLPVGSLL